MSTMAANSTAVPYAPVSAPVAVSRPSDAGQSPAKSESNGSDPFGPAVIVELSPEAIEFSQRVMTEDEELLFHKKGQAEYLKSRGKTDDEISAAAINLEKNFRESRISAVEGKKYESRVLNSQPNLEQALLDSGGPQSLINAVRDVTSVRYDVGASGVSEASYATEENRARVRATHGEEYLQKAIARGKVSDARARGASSGSASALSRYGIDKPAFTVTDTPENAKVGSKETPVQVEGRPKPVPDNDPSKLWGTITVRGRVVAKIYEKGVFSIPNGVKWPPEAVEVEGAEARANILTAFYEGTLERTRPKGEEGADVATDGTGPLNDMVAKANPSDDAKPQTLETMISEELFQQALTADKQNSDDFNWKRAAPDQGATGALKLNSFTLQNVGGGYSLAFDAERSEYKVSRQGVDITAAIFAGKAFSQAA